MNTFIFVWDRSGKRPPRAMHPLLVSTTRRAIEVRMGTHGPMHTLVPLVVRVNPCRGLTRLLATLEFATAARNV